MATRTLSIQEATKDIATVLKQVEDDDNTIVFIIEGDEIRVVLLSPEGYQALVGPASLQQAIEQLRAMGLTGDENFNDVFPRLRELFPWIEILEKQHRQECVDEILSTWRQFRATGDRWPLREALEGWEATAEVESDPELVDYLTRPRNQKEHIPWEEVRARLYGDTDDEEG